ncbi:MAG: hypothetical protein K0R73_1052 [Candidatus Midichloriaceae bacterium]|jgi:hypothetical protein|nr:hypothetical protein [Candidatus Midichloriaceae bacterium]
MLETQIETNLKDFYKTQIYISSVLNDTDRKIVTEVFINLRTVEYNNTHNKGLAQELESVANRQIEYYSSNLVKEEEIKESALVEIESIFQEDAKKIAIYGKAGMGKSTLCRYIAVKWQKNELFADKFKAVVWITLKDLASCNQNFDSGLDLLSYTIRNSCMTGLKEARPEYELIKKYLLDNANKVLLLIDGYDEISHLLTENRLLAENIYQLFTSNFYIVATSRPMKIAFHNSVISFDKVLETIGFNKERMIAYVKKFRPDKEVELLDLLSLNGRILNIANVPLNLEIICGLNLKNTDKLCTLTALYNKITEELINRAPQRLDLDEELTQELTEALEDVAFTGMLNDGQMLQIEDGILLKAMLATGLVKESMVNEDKHVSFIYHTFQEYFAARKIAKSLLYMDGEYEETLKMLKANKYEQYYEMMFSFVVGCLYQHHKKGDKLPLLHFWDVFEQEPRDLLGLIHEKAKIRLLEECPISPNEQDINELREALINPKKLSDGIILVAKDGNTSAHERLYALEALINLEAISNAAIPALLQLMNNDKNISIRLYAAESVLRLGEASKEALTIIENAPAHLKEYKKHALDRIFVSKGVADEIKELIAQRHAISDILDPGVNYIGLALKKPPETTAMAAFDQGLNAFKGFRESIAKGMKKVDASIQTSLPTFYFSYLLYNLYHNRMLFDEYKNDCLNTWNQPYYGLKNIFKVNPKIYQSYIEKPYIMLTLISFLNKSMCFWNFSTGLSRALRSLDKDITYFGPLFPSVIGISGFLNNPYRNILLSAFPTKYLTPDPNSLRSGSIIFCGLLAYASENHDNMDIRTLASTIFYGVWGFYNANKDFSKSLRNYLNVGENFDERNILAFTKGTSTWRNIAASMLAGGINNLFAYSIGIICGSSAKLSIAVSAAAKVYLKRSWHNYWYEDLDELDRLVTAANFASIIDRVNGNSSTIMKWSKDGNLTLPLAILLYSHSSQAAWLKPVMESKFIYKNPNLLILITDGCIHHNGNSLTKDQAQTKDVLQVMKTAYQNAGIKTKVLDSYLGGKKLGIMSREDNLAFARRARSKRQLFLTKLHEASRDGDIGRVHELVQARNIDINDFNNQNWQTPLILAIENKHWEVVEYLVENGADVNIGGAVHLSLDNQDIFTLMLKKCSFIDEFLLEKILQFAIDDYEIQNSLAAKEQVLNRLSLCITREDRSCMKSGENFDMYRMQLGNIKSMERDRVRKVISKGAGADLTLRLRLQIYLELLMNLSTQKGQDLPKIDEFNYLSREETIAKLKSEIKVITQTFITTTMLFYLLDDNLAHSYSEEIVLYLANSKIGEEYIIMSGSSDPDHCMYVALHKLNEKEILVRIDNRFLAGLSDSKKHGKAPYQAGGDIRSYCVGIFDLIGDREILIEYIKKLFAHDVASVKFPHVYGDHLPSNIALCYEKLPEEVKKLIKSWSPHTIQEKGTDNCTLSSYNLGISVRHGMNFFEWLIGKEQQLAPPFTSTNPKEEHSALGRI